MLRMEEPAKSEITSFLQSKINMQLAGWSSRQSEGRQIGTVHLYVRDDDLCNLVMRHVSSWQWSHAYETIWIQPSSRTFELPVSCQVEPLMVESRC
jgi:hypothetical protein